MKTFRVIEHTIVSRIVSVEAENEAEAIEKAQEVNGEDWSEEGWDDPTYEAELTYDMEPAEPTPIITPK